MLKKTIRILSIIIFIILAISLAYYIHSYEETDDPLSNLKHVNTGIGFGMNPPENWNVKESYTSGYQVEFTFSESNDPGIITLLITSTMPGFEPLDFDSIVNDKLNPNLDENTSMTYRQRTVNGMNAFEFVWIRTNETNAKIKEIIIENNDRVFYVYYGENPELYDKYEEIVEQSIESIVIV